MNSENGSIFSQDSIDDLTDETDLEKMWESTIEALSEAVDVNDFNNILLTIKSSLVNSLKYVAIDDLQTKLLRYAMPGSLKLFRLCFERIDLNLTEKYVGYENKVQEFLKIAGELLLVMDDTLAHIISWSKVDTMQIESLLRAIASMVFESYKHCKESEEMYGSIYMDMKELLTTLFRKTGDVQNRFYILLNNVLVFDTAFGDAIRLLVDVINVLSEIGEMVVMLDLKTMVEHWRGFTKLVQQHAEVFRPYINLAPSMKFLSTHVIHILTELNLADVGKNISKQLKIGSFVLKIIISLCDIYGVNLIESHSIIIDLLITLYSYSAPCLHLNKIPVAIIDAVESHLIVGGETLLIIFIPTQNFAQECITKIETCYKVDSQRMGLLFFTLTILRKISEVSNETQLNWFSNNNAGNIVGITFKMISKCHVELLQEIRILVRSENGLPSKVTTLYEYIVCSLATCILMLESSEYQRIESILLENILQTNIWNALVAIDLWCILSRYGSSELCYDQLIYLLDFYSSICNDLNKPERTFINVLISRLYPLLPIRLQIQIVDRFKPLEQPHLWNAIGLENLPEKIKKQQMDELTNTVVRVINEFLLEGKITNPKFYHMCNIMLAVATCSSSSIFVTNTQLILAIIELWKKMKLSTKLTPFLSCNEITSTGSNWLHHFLICLCQVTEKLIVHMDNAQIRLVLERIVVLQPHLASNVKLCAASILRSLATKVFGGSPENNDILSLISGLFNQLLSDNNPLVKQSTLEAFDFFAHVTSHESIVVNSVAGNDNLQKEISDYLQQTKKPAEMPYCTYLKLQASVNYAHKCKEELKPLADTVDEPLLKKLKFDKSIITSKLNCLKQDVNFLIHASEQNMLNSSDKDEISLLLGRLHKII